MLIDLTLCVLGVIFFYRLSKELHHSIFQDDDSYYVESETTKWRGWVKRTKH
jgi:hypothetical protein